MFQVCVYEYVEEVNEYLMCEIEITFIVCSEVDSLKT